MDQLENKIVLGSSSPRRKELLSMICNNFEVISPNCDETLDMSLGIENAIIDVSKRKALSIKSDKIVITADTLVVLDDNILSKPKDFDDAFNTLSKLSNNTHKVITAVTIKTPKTIESFNSITEVSFFDITTQEIINYINTNEPFDKAGSYGIQGLGSLFVKSISGDFYGVIGLPISTLNKKIQNIISKGDY